MDCDFVPVVCIRVGSEVEVAVAAGFVVHDNMALEVVEL